MSGVLVPTISEQAWLDARRQGVTASEIAVLMGLSPYSSPFELYYRKRGELPDQPDNDAMAIGRAMENYVADYFRQKNPEFYLQGSGRELWQHKDRPWQMATPDRVVHESRGVVSHGPVTTFVTYDTEPLAVLECKVDNGDGFGDEGTDEIPVHYRCQVLWQMDTLGVTTGYLAALIWHRRQVRVYELTMDDRAEADLSIMRAEACDFLNRIEAQLPPEPDWRPATRRALQHLHPSLEDREVQVGAQITRSYRAAVKHYKEAERRKDEMTNRIRAAMGSARYAASNGQRIARRDVFDVKEHVRKASTTDKIVPLKEKP